MIALRTEIAKAREEWQLGAMIDHGEALLAKIRHISLQRNVRQGSTELERVVKEAVQAVWADLHLDEDDWKAGNDGLLGRGFVSWHEQGARASEVLLAWQQMVQKDQGSRVNSSRRDGCPKTGTA